MQPGTHNGECLVPVDISKPVILVEPRAQTHLGLYKEALAVAVVLTR